MVMRQEAAWAKTRLRQIDVLLTEGSADDPRSFLFIQYVIWGISEVIVAHAVRFLPIQRRQYEYDVPLLRYPGREIRPPYGHFEVLDLYGALSGTNLDGPLGEGYLDLTGDIEFYDGSIGGRAAPFKTVVLFALGVITAEILTESRPIKELVQAGVALVDAVWEDLPYIANEWLRVREIEGTADLSDDTLRVIITSRRARFSPPSSGLRRLRHGWRR
jgi:hypothetical protein